MYYIVNIMNRIYMTFSRIIQHDKKQNHDDKIAIRNLNLQEKLVQKFRMKANFAGWFFNFYVCIFI